MGENESAKYWLSVLNGLKNRGVKDILIICADGLIGIKEAIATAFPKTEYQRCIVHQVRNTMKYVSDIDRKPFCADLKTIYQAATEEKALEALERVTEKWSTKYPNSMRSWKQNWDAISPIFKVARLHPQKRCTFTFILYGETILIVVIVFIWEVVFMRCFNVKMKLSTSFLLAISNTLVLPI